MNYTNNQNVPIPLAVWLLHDDYDHVSDPNYVSATTLLKPAKQIILARRVPKDMRVLDISDLIASRMGTALHDSLEKAWSTGVSEKLQQLGYPEPVTSRMLVNPTPEQLKPDSIPVYLEQRKLVQVGNWTVGGKFDMVLDGAIHDFKSTSAYTWLYGTKDEDYKLQLSLYKWLNPEIVFDNVGYINFLFTDWSKAAAAQNPNYPQKRLETKAIELYSSEYMQKWVEARLESLHHCMGLPEKEIPECTDEDLWRSDPVYKYYKDATKTDGRSTKNFTSLAEANDYKATKGGGLGVVVTFLGEAKRCSYCPAFEICQQKNRYL